MSIIPVSDTWAQGSPYERYIGRWSRGIAPLFISWLDLPRHKRWLDIGCGTGLTGFGQAGGGVVVGERQYLHMACGRPRHQFGGRERAVGMMTVRVQVD